MKFATTMWAGGGEEQKTNKQTKNRKESTEQAKT